MSKPRDACGNDLIVPSTLVAMEVARAAGLEQDHEFIKKLANGLYNMELKRIRKENEQISMS